MTGTALVAADLVLAGKGILFLDADSTGPLDLRMLVTTPGLNLGISGVVLDDETFRGRVVPGLLAARGMLAGIRVDTGTRPLAGAPGETVTEGLDGLGARLAEYAALGARFATWRAVLRAGDGRPSWPALRANAHALARYARACQEAGLVAVAEVAVPGSGCWEVTSAALMAAVTELQEMEVALDGVVLRTAMVASGTAAPETVARQTLAALWCAVPEELAGVAFAADGQAAAQATANLAAIRRLGAPWPVTFAFGRALTDPALAAWHGDPSCVAAGQRALANRVACNVAALQGSYAPALEASYVLASVRS